MEFLNLRAPVAATWVMITGKELFTSKVRVDLRVGESGGGRLESVVNCNGKCGG